MKPFPLPILFCWASHALQQRQPHLQPKKKHCTRLHGVSRRAGESALKKVQWFGQRLTHSPSKLISADYFGSREDGVRSIFELADNNYEATTEMAATPATKNQQPVTSSASRSTRTAAAVTATAGQKPKVKGLGGSAFTAGQKKQLDPKEKQVWEALANLEADMQLLDRLAGQRPQLSAFELGLLSTAVVSSACSPLILAGHITEFIAPAAAAFTAAIGIAAEYTGKVAVADGKEVAAASIQCAAEAEGFLANAERAKAITPLCVGIGATSATLALLVPVLLDSIGVGNNLQLVTEIYLCCPLVAVLAAAVAGLAVQETKSYCNQAIGVGNRRFARSGVVGRTWLSATELIDRKSTSTATKWKSFSVSVLPAPLLGALLPGALPTKTIVVAALAAAESAFYLARAEYMLSRAMDAVALKGRSAAVCDTYANQGARSAAILPFTSALSGLCAAATAAIVELPFVEALAAAGPSGVMFEIVAVSAFPFLSALFAAAASVSKARCQVDAEAAMQAASTIALPYNDDDDDPILRPVAGVVELIRLTISNSVQEPMRRFFRRLDIRRRWNFFVKTLNRRNDSDRAGPPKESIS